MDSVKLSFPLKGNALKRHCKCHFCKLIIIILEKRTVCSLKIKIKNVLDNCHFISYTAVVSGTELVVILPIAFLSFHTCLLPHSRDHSILKRCSKQNDKLWFPTGAFKKPEMINYTVLFKLWCSEMRIFLLNSLIPIENKQAKCTDSVCTLQKYR